MSRASEILDLAFDLGLYAPRVTNGYEGNGAKLCILTFGQPSLRKTMMFAKHLTIEDIERRIQQEVGHLPLVSVSRRTKQTA